MRTACLLTVSQHALGRGRCVSQHALGRGEVCTQACTGQGGGVYPSKHWAGGCVSHHALGRGCLPRGVCSEDRGLPRGGGLPGGICMGVSAREVSAWGVSAQGVYLGSLPGKSAQGDVYPGGCLPRGVSAQGVSAQGVVSTWGCLSGGVCPVGVCGRHSPSTRGRHSPCEQKGRVQHESWAFKVLGYQAINPACCDGIREYGYMTPQWSPLITCFSTLSGLPIYCLTNWDVETNASFYMRGVGECLSFLIQQMVGELGSGCILFSWRRHRNPLHLLGRKAAYRAQSTHEPVWGVCSGKSLWL